MANATAQGDSGISDFYEAVSGLMTLFLRSVCLSVSTCAGPLDSVTLSALPPSSR